MSDTVWIEVEVVTVTERAICVDESGVHSTWVPKSMVHGFRSDPRRDSLEDVVRRDRVKLELPEWLVHREDLDRFVCEEPNDA